MNYDDWKTTDPRDTEPDEPAAVAVAVCTVCAWTGTSALVHHQQTGHAVRGASWPAAWDNARFSCCPHGTARERGAA